MKRKRMRLVLMVLTVILSLNLGSIVEASSAATPFSSHRWRQPEVTYVFKTQSNYYRSIYKKAIKAWNKTGDFKFIAGTSKDHDVVLTTSAATTGKYNMLAGITFTKANSVGYFTSATVKLLRKNLATYKYSKADRVHVAEHELGHVIGLQHSTNSHSVMMANNRYNAIAGVDKSAVAKRDIMAVGKSSLSLQ
ncbi:matrixin family metalloprotease [Lactiplantibacillus songbeiensis]|uniref:Matrixin family metalloprotease n=1 Tax=Lactiplantibacillus songbeiensis TaxID=2559920 RepID=A0ABW4BZB0_9LACO|nr:M57 family metalloprotease [Lactiplantibacillus songbeiensis]